MKRTFEQIQHCAIVEYQSPLTQDKPVVGVFYKQGWEFLFHLHGERRTIKVTPSQTCEVIKDCITVILQEYMQFYADLRIAKEKEENSEW
jgi:hypothetical protein